MTEDKPSDSNVENIVSSNDGYKYPKQYKGADKALVLLDEHGPVTLTSENNKQVLRKIDWHLLPFMLMAYFLQQLDKSTLSYSSVFGIVTDAHLHGKEYSWLGSVVYIAQLVTQPLIAYILVYVPPGRFLAINMFCWGTVLSFMALAHNFTGLLITRLLMGIFEATIAPTFVAINQLWYRRSEQTNRTAAWYSMNGLAYVIGSLLSYGLGHIKSSKLYSYQIIFLFCGLLTVVVSIFTYLFFPDSPLTAKFLTEEERLIAIERIRLNQTGVSASAWKWDQAWETVLDPKTWLWTALLFCIAAPSGGVSTFGSLLIESFGYDKYATTLLNVPWGVLQIIVIICSALVSTKLKLKSPVLTFLCIPPIIGCGLLYGLPRNDGTKGGLLAGYYLTGFYTGISPILYTWASVNTAGDTKKKLTTAFLFMGQSAGNIAGPLLYSTTQAPLYRSGLRSNLALFSILIALVWVTVAVLLAMNKYHTKKCHELGKEPPKDYSMVDSKRLDDAIQADGTDLRGAVMDNSLLDITDLKNEDFVYII